MSCYVGIDPGKKGAFAALDGDGRLLAVETTVDPHALAHFLNTHKPRHVFLEKAQSMPRQGIASAFNYGVGYGELIGVLTVIKTPYTLLRPAQWTKYAHTGTKDGAPKERSAEAFKRLFAGALDLARRPKGGLHDGIVDAALIALYGITLVNYPVGETGLLHPLLRPGSRLSHPFDE